MKRKSDEEMMKGIKNALEIYDYMQMVKAINLSVDYF